MDARHQAVADVLEVALAAGLDHDKTPWEQAQDLADDVLAAIDGSPVGTDYGH